MPTPEITRVAESSPVVRARGISKYFGGVRALDHVSLDLFPGEITGIVGDNGAGKSTFVNVLSGIHQPDEGRLWLGEAEVQHLTPARAHEAGIQTVYQQLFLCDNLGAAANVMLGQEPIRFRIGPFRWIDQAQSVAIASRYISELGIQLEDLIAPVRRLSGGQRQAIAIARATSNAQQLILFDEPTAALGIRQTQATLEVIQRVAAQGIAVIVISHSLDEVFAICHRIVVFRHGRIVFDAPPDQCRRESVVAAITGVSFGDESR